MLLAACSRSDAREEINNPCTDNAISALGKFIQFQGPSGQFDVNTCVGYFFSLLPLVEDCTEGPNCYSLLCSLVERCARSALSRPILPLPLTHAVGFLSSRSNHAALMSAAALPRLVAILVGASRTDFMDSPTGARAQLIIKQLFAQSPPEFAQQLVAQLDLAQRAKLEQLLV